MKRRDSFKNRTYDAEHATAWTAKAIRCLSPAEGEAFLRRLCARQAVQRAFPGIQRHPSGRLVCSNSARHVAVRLTVQVNPRLQNPHARPTRLRIAVPARGLPMWLWLHELAHLLAPYNEQHGRAWRLAYLRLVRAALGAADWRALRDAFKAAKLAITKPRHLTPAHRAALAQRLRTYRAERAAGSIGGTDP